MGLASNRKAGFPCLFGKGKGSSTECKGKIEKSHPIVPKNEEKKKARMAPQVLEAMRAPPKAPKPAAPKPPVPKPAAPKLPAMPRKMAPPKAYILPGASRVAPPPAGPGGVWGQKGAAPVLANAHLPDEGTSSSVPAQTPRPAEVPVGLVLEEALTKAQKKNMARKKKRQAAAGLDAVSEASNDPVEAAEAAELDAAAARAGAAAARAAGHAALIGFDGLAVGAGMPEHMLERQGHKFISDVAQFNKLLGLYCDSSDDEAEDEYEVEEVESTYAATPEPADAPAATYDGVVAPFTPEAVPMPGPIAVQPAPAAVDKDPASEEAAFQAAVALSIRQHQLEEEIRKQQEVLVYGFQQGGGFGAFSKPPPASYAYTGAPGLPLMMPAAVQAPVAAPVVAPVAVPLAVPPSAAAPVAAPPAPSVLYNQTKPQPEVPAATYGGGWVFGGGNQGLAGGGHGQAGGYAVQAHPYAPLAMQHAAGGNPMVPMAAGHSAPEVAADEDDDDDLNTLFALCGVA